MTSYQVPLLDAEFNLEDYKNHAAWSNYICDRFGEAAAVPFVIGSDIVLDYLEEDLSELSQMPQGTHGCERNLQRCHIIPDSLGGKDEPANIVLVTPRVPM